MGQFISGVILQDETIRQKSSKKIPFADLLTQQSVIPGIKVDTGAKVLAGSPDETVTEGLDGLRDRLKEYLQLGARFAKWRAVIRITDKLPTSNCIGVNAHALARYAAVCQEEGIVPIVEPEVLMDGSHTIDRCEEVTAEVLHETFGALHRQHVSLEAMLLKPNMVIAGQRCNRQSSNEEVALATVRCLRRHAPSALPGVVFLSGGQDHVTATENLNAINHFAGVKPWPLSFSFGRALQDEALRAWRGQQKNLAVAQKAFLHRCRCASAAAQGRYTKSMEVRPAA
jgi:fructose-bisphosphate aldolase class I